MATLNIDLLTQKPMNCYGSSGWSALRSASSGADPGGGYVGCEFWGGSTYTLYRFLGIWDTSSIPDDAIIDSATVYFNFGSGDLNQPQSSCIVQHTSASDSSIVFDDYDQITLNSPQEGTARRALASNDGSIGFSLNSTGLGWINKTGVTKLAWRSSLDVDNSAPTVNARGYVSSGFQQLSVTYHVRVGPFPTNRMV